jgi:2-polyprenyl-3-methyl-5-hydroxy-6-metoxy-1,4-benzoquinol methylase
MNAISKLDMRWHGPEMMDVAGVDAEQLHHAMQHLQVINCCLNGYGPSLRGISALIGARREFSLLDAGCGTGDTLRVIAKWAERQGIAARLVGIELSAESAKEAAEQCRSFRNIEVRQADLFEEGDERYDVVHGALLLHHFDGEAAAASALRQMANLATMGVVINDLHRHWFAYHSISMLTKLLSRSAILHNDAPLSVARAFTREELLQIAKLARLWNPVIEWHWAFRWLLVGRVHGA